MTANYRKISVGFAAILLIAPFFAFAASAGDIVITEIAYDLEGADDGHEWMEIHNTTALEIDLTSWKFNDSANHLLNMPPKNGGQGALTIPAGGYAILADDAVVFLSDHPSFSGAVIDTVMSLNNTATTLAILDKDGTTIDSVAYQKEWGANGNGMTLEKTESWKESAQEGGTPGAANSVLPPTDENATSTESLPTPQASSGVAGSSLVAEAGENIIALAGDEVFFDGSKSQGAGTLVFSWNFGDGAIKEGKQVLHKYPFPGNYIVTLKISNGTESVEDQLRAEIYPNSIKISEFVPNPANNSGEWVELLNRSSFGVDISGWGLGAKDSKSNFKIPENTFLTGNGFLTLSETITGISLSDSGGIYLFYPNGQIAEKIEYEDAPKSSAAVLSADGRYEWSSELTPGAKNITVSYGALRDNVASTQVSYGDKTISQAKNKSSFVEYKKHNGVKSFIAEPAFAQSVADIDIAELENNHNGAPNTALSYFAFGQYRYAALIIAWLAFIGWLFYLKKNKKQEVK